MNKEEHCVRQQVVFLIHHEYLMHNMQPEMSLKLDRILKTKSKWFELMLEVASNSGIFAC